MKKIFIKKKFSKRAISISVFIVMAIAICIADGQQQKAFQNVREAYEQYESRNYNEAYELFYSYYSHTDNKIYCRLIEYVNGHESIVSNG